MDYNPNVRSTDGDRSLHSYNANIVGQRDSQMSMT